MSVIGYNNPNAIIKLNLLSSNSNFVFSHFKNIIFISGKGKLRNWKSTQTLSYLEIYF